VGRTFHELSSSTTRAHSRTSNRASTPSGRRGRGNRQGRRAGLKGFGGDLVIYVFDDGGMLLDLAIGGQKFIFRPAALGRVEDHRGGASKKAPPPSRGRSRRARQDPAETEQPQGKQEPRPDGEGKPQGGREPAETEQAPPKRTALTDAPALGLPNGLRDDAMSAPDSSDGIELGGAPHAGDAAAGELSASRPDIALFL